MSFATLLLVSLTAVAGLGFTNRLNQVNTAFPRFQPQGQQVFNPIRDFVLTTNPANAPYQNPGQLWTSQWATVVATGPEAVAIADMEEGDTVLVGICARPIRLNADTGDATLASARYCVYRATEIVGRLVEQTWGVNRNTPFTSRIVTNRGPQLL